VLNISIELLNLIRQNARLFNSEFHGIYHWHRVERNGLYLALFSGADKAVISHFAYLHDAMRKNEYADPEHGPRAAEFAKANSALIALDDVQFKQLRRALSGHTHGKHTTDVTIATCWDADRLDLGRVGTTPDEKYLLTTEA